MLGVNIHEDITNVNNYDSKKEKIHNFTYSWKSRGFSLVGQVTMLNSLVSSLFVYKMNVLPAITNDTADLIDKIISDKVCYMKMMTNTECNI